MMPRQIDAALVSLTAPNTFAAEKYQGLRLRIEQLKHERGVTVLAVTSPDISAGKTVTSINLAVALARGAGARVLLIDSDLRRPAVGAHLGLHGVKGAGLAEGLGDEHIELRQIVRPLSPGSTVAVILAGAVPTHVSELIRSRRFEILLQEARALYDFVIIDTPPLAPVYDAAVLSRLVDGILIVVAAHETPRKLLEETLNLVDGSKVLGMVFNGDDSSQSQYDAYYKR